MTAEGPGVLISSAGRRVGLVRAFQEALRSFNGPVVASDYRPELSAACQIADVSAAVPPIDDAGFLDATLEVAQRYGVGLVIPTLDTELLRLAAIRSEWAEQGIHVSIPEPELVGQCRDKRLTADLFDSVGISPLREVQDEYPRFIKPISGSSSIDVHVASSPEEVHSALTDSARYLHQELVDRRFYDEYTIDALYSRSGQLVCAVPRRRIEVRGGEISKGRTEKGPLLALVRSRLTRLRGARGCLAIQVFYSRSHAERPLIGIEVNPRFGGGYPMSHAAGADFAWWLTEEAFGTAQVGYREDWADGVTLLRFDDQVVSRSGR